MILDDDLDRSAGVEADEALRAVDDVAPLLDEGTYDVKTLKLERRRLWGRPVTMLTCEVVGGRHDGTRLIWCATSLPKGRKRVPISSKLYRAIVLTLGKRPTRGEPLDERVLVHKMFRGVVRTVVRGADGRPLPPAARYSVVDAFTERLA